MKTFKYFAFIFLIAIIGTAIYIAVQPNEFSFSRSRVMKAPAPVIFKKINDFENWQVFSPWIERHPNTEITYGTKHFGVGATYNWHGAVLGEGSIKTVAANENQFMSQHMSTLKPYESESEIHWDLEPTDEGTKVTWSIEGEQSFMAKMYATFTGSVETHMGPDFERGLFKLDSIVTADMKVYSITVNGITDHGGGYYLYNSASCKIDEVESKMQDMLPKVKAYALKNNITMAGSPFIHYITWDAENNAAIISCCVPTTDRVITTDSDILTGQLLPFKAIKTTLKGNYSHLKEAWATAMKYIPEHGFELEDNGPMLEVYTTDSATLPNPADWVTELYIAIKQTPPTE
ncbi:SRPBCC family protein [Confluentibacter sediminis]|uniref:SRPBCC family protein n=1 Tax=Confluentibacter sediminis TaxID=2219045 RepID=UPI000DADA622|nr:GyrI-like domain-containing protein [Confluentibacter sediminis]